MYCAGADLHPLVYYHRAGDDYIHLLKITHWHNKAAVVTKILAKSIYLGLQLQQLTKRCINNHADYTNDVINFAWHNKFIDTFPTGLLTPICKFLTFL